MSKVCIVGLSSLKHMSLISIYENLFNEHNIEYDLINIEKDLRNRGQEKNRYVYQGRNNKLLNYLGFLCFFLKLCLIKRYDKIIVWNTQTALLISPILLFKKNRYIINIRDYSYEKHLILSKYLKYIYKRSIFNTISSPGFKAFLPEVNEYLMLHSMNSNILSNIKTKSKMNPDNISIKFIGYNRFNNISKKVIEAFKNDERFSLSFIGVGAKKLEKITDLDYNSNVEFIDSFPISDTANFLSDCDIINNIYGNNSIALTTALSIRSNYAIYLNKPILCSKDTYNGKIVEKLGIGKTVNYENINPNEIYSWYRNIDFDETRKNCDEYLEKVEVENKKTLKKILNFVCDKA